MNSNEFLAKVIHFLKPARTIPHTSWTAKNRWAINPKNVSVLFLGLAIFGVGESLLIQSTIGVSPWVVLAEGLSIHTNLSIGQSTALISICVLALWWPLRERPGFGTLSNIAVIAIFIQIGVDHIPEIHDALWLQLLYVLIGIGLVGTGSALYITCGMGPGPRDGLMTSLHRHTGIRIARVRMTIEIAVLVAGKLLGGSLGIGTAMFALFVGNAIATNLSLVAKFSSRSQ